MSVMLGNIEFDQIEEKLGYRLTEDDRKIWNEFHNSNANLDGMENCFHVFDIPRCIVFKGDVTGEMLLKMFTSNKLVNPVGKFQVFKK